MIREAVAPLEVPEEALDESLARAVRILIVEDDADQREWLEYRFRLLGFDTFLAGTGGEGLHLARRHRPHVVVLDARLPDQDGLEVCRRLADDSTTGDIPVILVSGLDRPDIVRTARHAGCRFFLHKPYDPNALLALVECSLQEG